MISSIDADTPAYSPILGGNDSLTAPCRKDDEDTNLSDADGDKIDFDLETLVPLAHEEVVGSRTTNKSEEGDEELLRRKCVFFHRKIK